MAARSFGTAEKLLEFMAVMGWIVVIAAVGLAYIAYDALGAFQAIVLGGSTVLGGLLMVGVAQLGLAQIATAQATTGILEYLRKSGGGLSAPSVSGAVPRDRDVPLTRRKPQ